MFDICNRKEEKIMGYGTKLFLAGVLVGCLSTMILGYLLVRYDEYKEKRKEKKNGMGSSNSTIKRIQL